MLQVYWSGALMYTNSSYRDDDGGDKFEEYMVVSFINPSNKVLGIDLLQGSPSSIKLISRTKHSNFVMYPFKKSKPDYLIIAPQDTVIEFFLSKKGDTGTIDEHFAKMKEIVNYSKMIYYNDEKDSIFIIPRDTLFFIDTISNWEPNLLERVRNRQH